MSDLRVTIIQSILHWEQAQLNRDMFAEKMATVKGETDLIVLPEMFNSGFSMNAKELAETMDGDTLKWMANQAAQLDCAVTGSLIILENDKYYNRMIWMPPDGKFSKYDKRHLFGLGGEDKVYTPGTEHLTVEWKGWKINLQICYDLRFPVWNRNTDGFDLQIFVSNWPEKRSNAWRTLLQARAIENQSFVIGSNRVGEDDEGFTYLGDSSLIDPMGEILFTEKNNEVIHTATINKDELKRTRRQLPFLQDGDKFSIFER